MITKIPYGYSLPESSVDEYFENARDRAQGWFDKVDYIATKELMEKSSHVPEIKTDVFRDVDSIANAVIDHAEKNKIDLIVMGTKGRTGLKRLLAWK